MSQQSKSVKLASILFLLLVSPVFPETYYVKTDGDDSADGKSWGTAFQTITRGLNSAKAGNNVWVAEGIYHEMHYILIYPDISILGGFEGTETSLEERNILEHPSVIDRSVFSVGVGNDGIIDGFHVANGLFDGHYEGGGILNYRKGIVSNCIIYSNSAFYGGGIYNNGIVTGCILYNNSAVSGGGIFNDRGTVTNCTIFSNTAEVGGGISNLFGVVKNCLIYNNSVHDISFMPYEGRGGGIANSMGIVINCTLYSNSADMGGGIFNDYNYKGIITNCVSWNNKNGDIISDTEYIHFSCFGDIYDKSSHTNGNIRCNPLFINTSGDPAKWDFNLQNGSPCIDAGTTDTAELPDMDIIGNPRPGEDRKVCMGAYESRDDYLPLPPQPPLRMYVSKTGNNLNGGSWKDAYTSLSLALSSLKDDIYEIWVAQGSYMEGDTIHVPGRVNLYGGFDGTEPFFEYRNITNNRSVIDGKNKYLCADNSGMIDGFYITNGYSYRKGGGIYNFPGGIVQNCIVHSNSSLYGAGGIINYYGKVTNCLLYSNNSIKSAGGGIGNIKGNINNCKLYSNTAYSDGGGVNNYFGVVHNCTLLSNYTNENGGGIFNKSGIISNSIIHFNIAEKSGGGISNNDDGVIYNCIISSNSNWGIYNDTGSIFNATLYKNKGGININSGSVRNCVSWQNDGTDIQGGTVYNSCFKEATGENGNINADPMFINVEGSPSTWIYQVRNGSPCIDAGNPDEEYNDGCQPPGKGAARCDMGAYGGPYNCNWGINIRKNDLIGFLTGKKILYNLVFPFADINADDKVDVADLILLISQ